MIYNIRHLTNYSYESTVASATLALRVTPRDDVAQCCLEHKLYVVPTPASVTSEHDFYGNSPGAPELHGRQLGRSDAIPGALRVDTARKVPR